LVADLPAPRKGDLFEGSGLDFTSRPAKAPEQTPGDQGQVAWEEPTAAPVALFDDVGPADGAGIGTGFGGEPPPRKPEPAKGRGGKKKGKGKKPIATLLETI
jgi:hypothetical protein